MGGQAKGKKKNKTKRKDNHTNAGNIFRVQGWLYLYYKLKVV